MGHNNTQYLYIDSNTIKGKGKSYTRHLLHTSFREKGKVRHKTIANLSFCSEDEIPAIKLVLKHKKNLSALGAVKDIKTVLGKRIGAVWAFSVIAQRLGIKNAVGVDLDGKLALVQVVARIIGQVSRLIDELGSIHMEDVHVGSICIRNIPTPNTIGKQLLENARITLPSVLPSRTANVHTKKELPSERIKI